MKKLVVILGLVIGFSLTANAVNLVEPIDTVIIKNNTVDAKAEATTETHKRVYIWSVETEYGKAKGVSMSLERAKKMVELTTNNDYKYGVMIKTVLVKK